MSHTRQVLLSCLFFSGLGLAQENDYHHNDITFGVGPAIPVGSTVNYLTTAPMIDFGYGYRFKRWFQAGSGLQLQFGTANNRNPEIADFGPILGGDRKFMLLLGGRVYIPQPLKRLEVSTRGTPYLDYFETASTGSAGYSVGCYSCISGNGWNGYGLADVRHYLDANRNFHVGTTWQFIAPSTSRTPAGKIPALETTNDRSDALFEFGFSF